MARFIYEVEVITGFDGDENAQRVHVDLQRVLDGQGNRTAMVMRVLGGSHQSDDSSAPKGGQADG